MPEQRIYDGGPAFPVEVSAGADGFLVGRQTGSQSGYATGLSIRDYFAAKAMQAIVSTITCDSDYERLKSIAESFGLGSVSGWIARESYKQADAMLKARSE